MKGQHLHLRKYKAWNQGIITSRVNPPIPPENVIAATLWSFAASGTAVEGYTPGAPLVLCPECQMRGHADRNASLVIGQRLIERYAEPFKEKPHTAVRRAGRVEQSTGVVLFQEAQSKGGILRLR